MLVFQEMQDLSKFFSSYFLKTSQGTKKSFSNPQRPSTKTTLHHDLFNPESMLPPSPEWIHAPINQLFTQNVVQKLPFEESPQQIEFVVLQALRFLTVLELLCPTFCQGIQDGSKIAHLMQVYLLENDPFLEPGIERTINALLFRYSEPSLFHKHNPYAVSKQLLPSPRFRKFRTVVFQQLFSEFIKQFSFSSYGNQVFAKFLVLQLQVGRFPFPVF